MSRETYLHIFVRTQNKCIHRFHVDAHEQGYLERAMSKAGGFIVKVRHQTLPVSINLHTIPELDAQT